MILISSIITPISTGAKLQSQLGQLKGDYPYFNWVPVDAYYVPVVNFGHIDNLDLPDIYSKISENIYDIEPTILYSQSVEINIKDEITLFVKFQRNKPFEVIQKRILDTFDLHELNTKENFGTSITIAKYKIPSKQQYLHLKKKISKIDVDIQIPVTGLNILESQTENQVSSLSLLKTLKLGDQGN